MDAKDDIILKLIKLILGEVGEYSIFDNESSAKYYFNHGGCFELYKIIAHYFPKVKMMMRKDYNHCAIYYKGNYYDVEGLIEDKENYILSKEDDYNINEELFSPKIKELKASSIIENINANVSLKGIFY